MKPLLITLLCLPLVWANPLQQKSAVQIKKNHGDRIIGGDEAKPDQFPWQVAVYFDTYEGSYFCGGALIKEQYILTAGHCVLRSKVFTLQLGTNSLVDNDPGRIITYATHYDYHPDFDPAIMINDLGIIRIIEPVQLSSHVQLINLPTSDVVVGAKVTVSGWGATGDWNGEVNHLNWVSLTTISNIDCQAVYGNAITANMVCASGKAREGVCLGDSGGPLQIGDGVNAEIVGVVLFSSAEGCETDHPSGFTRVFPYISWIKEVIA